VAACVSGCGVCAGCCAAHDVFLLIISTKV